MIFFLVATSIPPDQNEEHDRAHGKHVNGSKKYYAVSH